MDVLDIVLIVGALAIAALTFTQPPIMVAADIVALYAASVLAGALYVPASNLPVLTLLPQSDTVTVRLGAFVVLLVGGTLLLRALLRRVAGMLSVPRNSGGPLLGNVISAALSVVFALGAVLVAIVALAAIAQMPITVGVVTFIRDQLLQSNIIPRLDQPLNIYLRLVGIFFPNGMPTVYSIVSLPSLN